MYGDGVAYFLLAPSEPSPEPLLAFLARTLSGPSITLRYPARCSGPGVPSHSRLWLYGRELSDELFEVFASSSLPKAQRSFFQWPWAKGKAQACPASYQHPGQVREALRATNRGVGGGEIFWRATRIDFYRYQTVFVCSNG